MIQVKDLKKNFGSVEVLKGISFDVEKGEVFVIIGPSGSGKSTILRCLNFIEEYDGGEVIIDGELLGYRVDDKGHRTRQSEADIARMRTEVGMVFQSYNLFPHVNVIDNLTMAPIHVKGMAMADNRSRSTSASPRGRHLNSPMSAPRLPAPRNSTPRFQPRTHKPLP